MAVASAEVQLNPDVWRLVDATARQEGRPVGPLIADAIRRALRDNSWVIPPPKVSTDLVARPIALPADVLEQVAAAASRIGRSADQIIEDSVRRDLAARLLRPVFEAADARSPVLSEDAALQFAYDELQEVRSGNNTLT